jgi:hypothetical protein
MGAIPGSLYYPLPIPSHTVTSNHTFRYSSFRVHDSLATTALGDFLILTVSLLITDSGHILLRRLFIPLPVAYVNSGFPCYVTVGRAATCVRRSVDWPVTVAAAALLCHRWREGGGELTGLLPWQRQRCCFTAGGEGVSCIAQIRHNILCPIIVF